MCREYYISKVAYFFKMNHFKYLGYSRVNQMPLFIFPFLILLLSFNSELLASPKLPKTDAEIHYVNFFQETDGIQNLIVNMDKANVSNAMLTGMPLIKKWSINSPKKPRYYQGDDSEVYWFSLTDEIVARGIESLPEHQRKRFYPFICGFNPTDLNAVHHIERQIKWRPGFWKGIGELITRHDDLTALISGEKPTAHHKAVHKIMRLAAREKLPVLLHSNITSEREDAPIYLKDLIDILSKNLDVNIIWAHAGTSTEIYQRNSLTFLPSTISDLMNQFDNLYILLSWTAKKLIYNADNKPNTEMIELVIKHPDKFMVGSDLVGRFDSLEKIVNGYDAFLDMLPENIAKKVAYANFLRIMPTSNIPMKN